MTARPIRISRSPRRWAPASTASNAASTREPWAPRDRRPCRPRCCTRSNALETDPIVTGVLDVAGDGVASYFADVKRAEFFAYHGTVTPWEIDQYLTAF